MALAAALGFGFGVQGQLSPPGARERNAAAVQMLARSSAEVPNAVPTSYVEQIALRQPAPVAKPRPAVRKPRDLASGPVPFIDLAAAPPAPEPAVLPPVANVEAQAVDASTVASADPGVTPWTAPPPDPAEFVAPPTAR